ncbi:hypothetical protein SAMN05444920_110139 [Nonomuraea solani]|uniref:Uncharacterized protein n=1 Tax=Nonomuraea solani TaxID=1144553 RepID=A0A1H6EJJ3_9ACTN|nr:hypothetical protein [Nonomuraea solani]SEG96874.1 hypothetical protein SAMN05444920_110139 [Nonomuraea solani]
MRIHHDRIDYEITGLPAVALPAVLNADVAAKKVAGTQLNGRKSEIWGPDNLSKDENNALLWLLAHYCVPDRAGKTYRAILPLPGSPTGGQVILTYDKALNGKATLVGRGLPTGGQDPGMQFNQLADDIKTRYDLAGITGNWAMEEMVKLHHALALVPVVDRPALRGVLVRRVPSLDGDRHGAHTQGRFEHGAGETSGDWGTITLTDAAFTGDDKGFYGGSDDSPARPPSIQVILHEVGHAVDSVVRRTESRANADFAIQSIAGPHYPPNRSLPANAPITDAIQLRFQDLKDLNGAETLARDTYNLVAARKPADPKIADCERLGGKMAVFAQALRDMKADKGFEPAKALLEELQQEHRDLNSWYVYAKDILTRINGGEKFDADQFTKIQEDLAGKTNHQPWLTYHDELNRWAEVHARKSAWRKKYSRAEGYVTGREQGLVGFVNDNNVGVALTAYTKKYFEEDKSGSELYAEGYGLWLVHPEALGSHSPALLAYFRNGAYLKGD